MNEGIKEGTVEYELKLQSQTLRSNIGRMQGKLRDMEQRLEGFRFKRDHPEGYKIGHKLIGEDKYLYIQYVTAEGKVVTDPGYKPLNIDEEITKTYTKQDNFVYVETINSTTKEIRRFVVIKGRLQEWYRGIEWEERNV